jgi:cellobiose-specific phosphotransferase system component IIA
MVNATKATKSAGKSAVSNKEETLVVLSPKIQKSVKALREAHDLEKQVDEMISVARSAILEAVPEGTDVIGTDAKGKRLVKVQIIYPKSVKVDTKALTDFLGRNHPEILEMFVLPPNDPSQRVYTL